MPTTMQKKLATQSFLPVLEDRTLVGLWLDDVGRIDRHILTREEEGKLGRRIEEGDEEAYNEFVRHNFRLVMSIARNYRIPGRQIGMEYADLIQEGNIGLLAAIQKWNPHLGLKFSTYATYWIHQRISRAIDDGGIIRIPVYVRGNIRKVSRAITEYLELDGRAPTIDDLVKITDLSQGEVLWALDVMGTKTYPYSIDSAADSTLDDASSFVELIADHYADEELRLVESKTPALRQMMAAILKPRELLVVELRCGFRGRRSLTLEEVGRELGVTRERIRQIQLKAFKKLFKHSFFHALFREHYGFNPPTEFDPPVFKPAGRRNPQRQPDNGHPPLEEERRELLTRWGSDLVEIPENEIELLANM